MRLSIIWRMMEGIYPDLHNSSDDMKAKFNNNKWLFNHSHKIIPSLKSRLFIDKFRRYRVVQYCKYSPNGRCHPSSCLLTVLHNWRHFSHIAIKQFQIWSTVTGYDEVWDFSQSKQINIWMSNKCSYGELHHYHNSSCNIIINNNPWVCIGYEMVDSQRGA